MPELARAILVAGFWLGHKGVKNVGTDSPRKDNKKVPIASCGSYWLSGHNTVDLAVTLKMIRTRDPPPAKGTAKDPQFYINVYKSWFISWLFPIEGGLYMHNFLGESKRRVAARSTRWQQAARKPKRRSKYRVRRPRPMVLIFIEITLVIKSLREVEV